MSHRQAVIIMRYPCGHIVCLIRSGSLSFLMFLLYFQDRTHAKWDELDQFKLPCDVYGEPIDSFRTADVPHQDRLKKTVSSKERI